MIRNSSCDGAFSPQPRNLLPVAAFLALTLPLAFVAPAPTVVEPTPDVVAPVPFEISQNSAQPRTAHGLPRHAVPHDSVPTAAADNSTPNAANAATQTAPVHEPAPLPTVGSNQNSTEPGTAVAHVPVPHDPRLRKAELHAPAPKGNARILISIPDRKMAVLKDGKVHKVYPVAVGAEVSPSPTGHFHIAKKIVAPSYSHDGKVVAPGKGNPLGSRWMGLDKEHYGIHGTNAPESIGHAASHGCIRMRKHDVEELFEVASVGDVVEIHDGRTEELAQIFAAEPAVVVAQAGTMDGDGGSR